MASQRMAYEQWFYDADTDKNGYLTKKELRKALKSKGYRVTSKQFKINCVFRALKHSLNPDELFRIMNHMDKDKTGTINYNEFLRYFLKESGYFDD
ncbi:hypothetical protein LSH36_189g06088 [Paralvinella palmiformis]|uniref:EF-hand domain-containing protein n=1 Tax=Paralvinella palmiformis TaxID=53620 RepID=A0AAD9JQX5_9ANNE|nr:hypothetical protein LSH36_189g06088 [Paralvinella palmiformis]